MMRDVFLGVAALPIVATASDLQELEKGRIHYIGEILERCALVDLTKNFLAATFSKNYQKSLSIKSNLAIRSTPLILASLRSSYASNYISTKVVDVAFRIEKYMGLVCYIASIVNAVALIGFGHLIGGCTALTVFGLDLFTSSIFIQNSLPHTHKIRRVFITYISPFATLITGILTRSYLSTGIALFGVYRLLSIVYDETIIRAKKSLPSINSLEQFQELWMHLHQKELQIYFEMNRTRVPQVQTLSIDPVDDSADKILEVFAMINWDRKDFQDYLWDRISGIVEKDPKKAFKHPKEMVSEEQWEAYRQEQMPRAKQMAKEWLDNLVKNTLRQDLVFFKQNICKMLLENKNLLQAKTESEQSRKIFKGLLTLIFGSGGQCHIAEEMKIKEAYLELYKACHKESNHSQSDFLLLLELLYKHTTEQAFKDTLQPYLHGNYNNPILDAKNHLESAQKELAEQWKSRSLCRISVLARSIFSYLIRKLQVVCLELLQKKSSEVNLVHNFTSISKLYGKRFNIVTDIDQIAERFFFSITMDPLSSRAIKSVELAIAFYLEKFYWDTQLERIIQPWLSTHFEEQTYFQLNDLTQWFFNLLEGFKTEDNRIEIDNMQEELWEEIPKINGYPIAQAQQIQGKSVLKPTTQSLLAFAYGINLLKRRDLESSFNYIDKKMRIYAVNKFDFTNFDRYMQLLKNFMPQNIKSELEKIQELDKEEKNKVITYFRKSLTSPINKETLFFVQ